jgi:hypothetical protein
VTDTVVIMAKYPEPGRVKTRLAAAVGRDAACELYRAFLCDLGERLRGGDWRLVWAVSPPGSRLDGIVPGPAPIHIDQRGDDLGSRMDRCFSDLFATGAERVVMVGADAPQLSASTIATAFATLDEFDVVLAPTCDGGYCLVGMREAHDLFSTVALGTDRVWEQTVALCGLRGLSVRELAREFDVDELADARDLLAWLGDSDELPACSRVLREWQRAGIL